MRDIPTIYGRGSSEKPCKNGLGEQPSKTSLGHLRDVPQRNLFPRSWNTKTSSFHAIFTIKHDCYQGGLTRAWKTGLGWIHICQNAISQVACASKTIVVDGCCLRLSNDSSDGWPRFLEQLVNMVLPYCLAELNAIIMQLDIHVKRLRCFIQNILFSSMYIEPVTPKRAYHWNLQPPQLESVNNSGTRFSSCLRSIVGVYTCRGKPQNFQCVKVSVGHSTIHGHSKLSFMTNYLWDNQQSSYRDLVSKQFHGKSYGKF